MGHIRVRVHNLLLLFYTFLLSPASIFAFTSFLTSFIFSGQEDYSFEELLPMAIIGVIGGLLGGFLFFFWVEVILILFIGFILIVTKLI